MSSVKSAVAPSHADVITEAMDAVTNVAEESFLCFFAPLDAAGFDTLAGKETGEWLDVSVRFTGSFAGSVAVAMPVTLAVELLDALLGRAPGEAVTPEEIDDLSGEFANMVCGAWLGRHQPFGEFALAAPTVRHQAASATKRDAGVNAAGSLNDRPIKVWITHGLQAAARSGG